MKQQIMIDCKTLGTNADACIVSIGAVKFCLETGVIKGSPFYTAIDIETNQEAGRKINSETFKWWLQQSKEAQAVFFEEQRSLGAALDALTEWVGKDECCVWSDGADFDIPMLGLAYYSFNMTVPWHFWNTRCYKTWKKLPDAPAMRPPHGTEHNALSDALNQAAHLCEIYKQVFKGKRNEAVQNNQRGSDKVGRVTVGREQTACCVEGGSTEAGNLYD